MRLTRGDGPAKRGKSRSVPPAASAAPELLVTLDPATDTGAALFVNGTLRATALLRSKSKAGSGMLGTPISRAEVVGTQLQDWLWTHGPDFGVNEHRILHVAYEWPQIYARGSKSKTKGDPNNMLMLAAIATGAVLALRKVAHVQSAIPYKPADWIGQLPKDTDRPADESPRGQLIARNLYPHETVVARNQLQHDVWDAIGIGLFHLGRLKRHVNHFA